MKIRFGLWLLVLLGLGATAGCQQRRAGTAIEAMTARAIEPASVTLEQCPEAVQQAFAAERGKVGAIVRYGEGSQATYACQIMLDNGPEWLKVAADGSRLLLSYQPPGQALPRPMLREPPVLGDEVAWGDCPKAVQDTFRAEANGEMVRVYQRSENGKLTYRGVIVDDSSMCWLDVVPDGKAGGWGMNSLFVGDDLLPAWESDNKPLPKIRPRLAEVTLTAGNATLRSSQQALTWAATYQVGGRRLVVTQETVTAFGADGRTLWQAKAPEERVLQWVTGEGQTAYLRALTKGQDVDEQARRNPTPEKPTQLRQLDLATGKWLAPLILPGDPALPKRDNVFGGALVTPEGLAVVTRQPQTEVSGQVPKDEPPATYRVSLFSRSQEKLAWVRVFAANEARPEPGVRLWSAVMPDFAGADIQPLSWVNNSLLVCAGEKEDVMLLDAEGKTKWELKGIWEFQRGFTGPSVWAHFMGRFGLDRQQEAADETDWTPEQKKYAADEREKFRQARMDFDKHFECAIIGGPVVVPMPAPGEPDAVRIFVAVAKGPTEWNAGYVSDCLLYELDGQGQVHAMASVPRLVDGGDVQVVPGGLVWACQQGAMLRVVAGTHWGDVPGSPDLLCPIRWYRQIEVGHTKAWLSAAPAIDALALSPTVAFRTVGEGFIARKGDHVYHFPISMVDLKTGAERTIELQVPFDGDVAAPGRRAVVGFGQISTPASHLLGITRLQLRGKTLEVVLGMEKNTASVSFDVGGLMSGK